MGRGIFLFFIFFPLLLGDWTLWAANQGRDLARRMAVGQLGTGFSVGNAERDDRGA